MLLSPFVETVFSDALYDKSSDDSLIVDLKPSMTVRPHTVFEEDPIQKCLDVFRLMNLRHLPVLEEGTGVVKGIITRQDLFKYMQE